MLMTELEQRAGAEQYVVAVVGNRPGNGFTGAAAAIQFGKLGLRLSPSESESLEIWMARRLTTLAAPIPRQ